MDLKVRISTLIKAKGLNIKSFAEIIGLPYATFVKQVGGERPVSLDTIMSILEKFPDISTEWLLRGDGQMLKSPEPQKSGIIDLFLRGICNSNKEELDEFQQALTTVRKLRNIEKTN